METSSCVSSNNRHHKDVTGHAPSLKILNDFECFQQAKTVTMSTLVYQVYLMHTNVVC